MAHDLVEEFVAEDDFVLKSAGKCGLIRFSITLIRNTQYRKSVAGKATAASRKVDRRVT